MGISGCDALVVVVVVVVAMESSSILMKLADLGMA